MACNKKIKFFVGDLVTYREDLLGLHDFQGVIIKTYQSYEGKSFAVVRWSDGEIYPELVRHLHLIVRAVKEEK